MTYPRTPNALARLRQYVRRTGLEGIPTYRALRYAVTRYRTEGLLPRYDHEFPSIS